MAKTLLFLRAPPMNELPPPKMAAALMAAARGAVKLGGRALGKLLGALGLKKISHLIAAAPFVDEIFGGFEFRGIERGEAAAAMVPWVDLCAAWGPK